MNSWLVVIPPLLVVLTALYTRKMILSFILGIIVSALIATHGHIGAALQLAFTRWWASTGLNGIIHPSTMLSNWNLCIFVFLTCVGTIIVLLQTTGAAQAYSAFAQRYIKNKRSTEMASLILATIFCIDDYFCALTVGSVMRPLTRRYGIHPLKLAFLTTAMASPLALLMPLSSWIGEIMLQLKLSGVNDSQTSIIYADTFYVMVKSIPFLFYPIIIIASAWYIVLRRISYGPLARYEQATHATMTTVQSQTNCSMIDFALPILSLIGSVMIGLLITGQYWFFGGANGFADAIKNAQIQHTFFAAGIFSVLLSMSYFLITKKQTVRDVVHALANGFMIMLPSIVMLVHAWTLGKLLTNDLQTGTYLASIISHIIHASLFPMICFVSATIIAWMIGSAWATIGLMFPIAIPMIPHLMNITDPQAHLLFLALLPVVGAVLSGSVLGTHYSFMSDTPLMSATSTGASHFEHVRTMAWYLLPITLGVICSYILIGILPIAFNTHPFWLVWLISLGTGLLLSCGLLELFNKVFKPV